MAAPRRFTVVARAADLSLLDQIPLYSALSIVPRFCDIGTWSLTYPADSKAARLLARSGGIQITRAGASASDPIMTGPLTSVVETDQGGQVSRVFSGVCDNVWLADKRAWPVPTQSLTNQNGSGYDYRTGDAETIMRGYVQANAGTGALSGRNTLVVNLEATNGHRGAATGYSARFQSVLEILQSLANSAGIGFRVRQIGSQLVYQTYTPVDHSGIVRFSHSSGSLAGYSFQLNAPTTTRAIVGDSGLDVGRVFQQFIGTLAESDWNRKIETFVDQRSDLSTTVAQIAQAGQDALNSGSPTAQVTFTAQDVARIAYGVDYGLGDKVSVEIADGTAVVDVVREVLVTDGSAGVTTSPTIGNTGASDPSVTPLNYKRLRDLLRRVGKLERR